MGPKTRTWRKEAPLYGLGILVLLGVLASCGGGGPRQLIGVSVQPASGQAIAPDGTVPFSATGTFDQAPKTQANLPVQWASSDSSVASIDPNSGIATCLAAGGPISVTASAAGKGGMVHGSGMLACQLSPDPVAKLDHTSLDFSCRQNGPGGSCACTPSSVTLTNVGGATLAIDNISTGIGALLFRHTDTCGASVEAGQSCSISVTFHPSILGTSSGELTVSDNAADSPQGVSLSGQADCTP